MSEDKQIPERTKGQKRWEKLFYEDVEYRKNGCMWDDGDWEDRWELQQEYALPRSEDIYEDNYRSNVRSPEVSGRIQSAMHKLAAMNVGFTIRPKNSAAKLAARVDELIVNHFFSQQMYKTVLRDAFYTGIVKGTSPIGVEWLRRSRKVQQVLSDPEKMTKEQKEKVKKGELVYAKVEMVDVNAPVLIHYPLESVYVDPAARNMQGAVFNSGNAFVTELIPFETFKSLYEDKEGYKDVDLVKPITKDWIAPEGNEADEGRYTYPPVDQNGEYVYVVKGWDYYKDEYKVRANDVFIKESPLPYADKKIPIEMLKPYSVPNQLYGVGMVDLLIPSVYQLELIQNAFYDWLIYTVNPILLVQRGDYGDFSRKYEVVNGEPGTLLPVNDPSSSVMPLKYPNIGVDVFTGIQMLQKDAVIASQHDPNQLGVMRKDATATANIINKEIAEAFANYIIINFTDGLENIARMVLSRIHEFMTRPQVSRLVNGELEDGEPFEVAIPGKYVDVDWDERTVKVEDSPDRVSVITVSEDLYEYQDPETEETIKVTLNDYEVSLSAESKQIISRALEQQKIKDAAQMILPYAVNPTDPMRSQSCPLPLFNAVEWADQFIDAFKMSPKLLLNQTENEKNDIKRAEEQNMEMYQGQRATPRAGESNTHVQIHTQFQQMLINRMEHLKTDIQTSIEAGMEVGQEQKQEFDHIKSTLPLVSEHIDFDTTLVMEESSMMSNAGKAASGGMEGQQPQMPGTGIGQSMTQSGMGADSALPNMPQQAGMTQGGAGPLTKM
jgi:hypothetical protein